MSSKIVFQLRVGCNSEVADSKSYKGGKEIAFRSSHFRMSFTQSALILPQKQSSFILSTRPIPAPKAGEILVKVKAISLNPIDWKIQSTGYMVEKYPSVLGTDVAGEVVSVGEGVKSFNEGDSV